MAAKNAKCPLLSALLWPSEGPGEVDAIGPPAAIANAVEDALRDLGVRVRETPLGPSRVRELIAAAEAGGQDTPGDLAHRAQGR